MKRFSILSVMAVAWLLSQACGPWIRPTYDVFSVYDSKQLNPDARLKPMYDFWEKYTDGRASSWTVDALSSITENELATSDNAVLATARMRGDSEMLAYLRHLITYLNIVSGTGNDTWNYPTRDELGNRKARMQEIATAARTYSGTRLRDQYALLQVRAMVHLGDARGVVDYWTKTGSALPETVYKDMMRGLYAWSLLSLGQRREAIAEYADMGDMHSIQWLVYNQRFSLMGVKQEFDKDNNSPTLVYLVQDYVNNLGSTLASLKLYTEMGYGDMSSELKSNRVEAQKFVDFALDVVKNNKTNSPAMWQAAAGLLTHYMGNTDDALKMLDKAMKMKGTKRMTDNARLCRLVASTAYADMSKKYQDYLCTELQWLAAQAKDEEHGLGDDTNAENHYFSVMTNLVYENLVPHYQKMGATNLATSLSVMMSNLESDEYPGYFSDLGSLITKLTADQLIDYDRFVKSGGDNKLEKWLVSRGTPLDQDHFNDLVGTKYLREGAYAKAIPYLEKVPLSLINEQGISRYMARRSYDVERWMRRQVVDRDWEDIMMGENIPVTYNQKLQYCRDVLKAEEAVNSNGTAENLYRLASLYYQASYQGDCWYLTRYFHSAYDSIEYVGEKDLVTATVELLKRAKQIATDPLLKQKCYYAAAFIPYGEPLYRTEYDANYKPYIVFNNDGYMFQAMFELANYYYELRGNVAPFISKCDVLKLFLNSAEG